MRKITKEAINAFYNGSSFNKGNTKVVHVAGVNKLILHNTIIAKREEGSLFINGSVYYRSNTTKERLNGLSGVHITQKNFTWYLNGELLPEGWVKV